MKKILGIFAAMILAASCFGVGGYEAEYTAIATFSFADTDFEGDAFRPDSLLYDTYYRLGLPWDHLAFYHNVDQFTMEFKGGFLVSRLKVPSEGTNVSGWHNNQYRANAKSLYSADNKYAVFQQSSSMPEKHFAFQAESTDKTLSTCMMKCVYVTNTVAMEQAIRTSFRKGDEVVFRATGYLGGQKTGSAEIKLAEYTADKDSVITRWTKLDLTPLGSIEQVAFEIISPTHVYLPTAVCMDDLCADISITRR